MLQEMRIQKGLSQNQLAIKCNIPLQTIQKYERGFANINHAKLETLLKICLTLECELKDIVSNRQLISLLNIYKAQQ